MRKRFETQLKFDQTPIEKVKIPEKSRDELPPVLRALQWIYSTPSINEEIFEIIEGKLKGDMHNGRPGMDLWHILVLGVVRLTLNTNYDRLEYLVHYDKLMRQIMGLDSDFQGNFGEEFSQKTIIDNIHLIDEEMLEKINQLLVREGLKVIQKKTKKSKQKLIAMF